MLIDDNDLKFENVVALPVDVNSLMAAYQLGYLTALEGNAENDFGKISPESYRKICEEMSISPADNINDLISEIVSGKISELLEARNEED